jgi:cysteine-rich repeat protein
MRAAAALVFAAGCNSILGIGELHSSTDAGVEADAAPLVCPIATGDTVVGCWFDDYVSDAGIVKAAHDLSHYTIQAYLPDPSAAGFHAIDAQTTSPGVFTIAGIPAQTSYYLRVVDRSNPAARIRFIVTDRRDLDLGFVTVGRPGVHPITKLKTVTMAMSAMTTWKPADFLLVDSFATDTENVVGEPNPASNPPKVGDTSLNVGINWQDSYGYFAPPMRLEAAEHDDFWLTHNTSSTINDDTKHAYVALRIADAFTSTTVDMADDSAPVTVSGAFTAVPTSLSQEITVNIADLRTSISAGKHYTWEDLNCGLLNNVAASYGNGIGPGIVTVKGNPVDNYTPPSQDTITLPALAYGNPYPASWPTVMPCSLTQIRFIKAPGAAKPRGRSHKIGVWDVPVTPYVFKAAGHAPTNVTIGGAPFLDGGRISFDGTAPVPMTWTAVPGTDSYTVSIEEVVLDVDKTALVSVASLDTTATTILLPGELFKKGHLYVFELIEQRQPATFATGHFNRTSTPHSGGMIASGVFRLSADCGNHATDAGEECDDGTDSAACDADCSLAACGDGYVNTAANEQCDDVFESPHCNQDTCKTSVCGDGHWNPRAGEHCDDGNTAGGDGCSPTCQLEHCGDGVINPFEECDDMNSINDDGCSFCHTQEGWTCTGAPSMCTRS